MLGSNIEREISPHKPKQDELAYVNRMKFYLKSHPNLKGSVSIKGTSNRINLSVRSGFLLS